MYIVMHCGGLPFNGDTIKTKSLGGSETAAYYVAKELVKLGHKVTLFTNSKDQGEFDGVRYTYCGVCSEQHPLGNLFSFYAESTPHDCLIIQRQPMAFAAKFASKINMLWLHDLALHRNKIPATMQLWNIDKILAVSEFHKQQIIDVHGVHEDAILPITNGVDLDLYAGKITESSLDKYAIADNQIKLLYTSRPERGLENHVKPDGIMERLLKIDPKYHLYVCGYENTTEQMKPYYEHLWSRVEELPNCTNLGPLTKQQLADVERQVDAVVYPTEFEEVSCITAMEAMAAGTPFISSHCAALPETCEGSGATLIPLQNDRINIAEFVRRILEIGSGDVKLDQLNAAKRFTWNITAKAIETEVYSIFSRLNRNEGSVAKHLMHVSDIYALQKYKDNHVIKNTVEQNIIRELTECYQFVFNRDWKKHYEKYYKYEEDRGVNYGPEDLSNNGRYICVSNLIGLLPDGSTILDYGCAHGHYTINLAKQYPNKKFIGVDIEGSSIDKARHWAKSENIKNVEFKKGSIGEGLPLDIKVDCIIAAEILEHVESAQNHVDKLAEYLKDGGEFIVTTPYGPWEADGYIEHYPWRAHVHHFDRADLADMFAHHSGFKISAVPAGPNNKNEILGSYITQFKKPVEPSRIIDYDRKFKLLGPKQTLSVCMIVGHAEETILKTLNSIRSIADELIIALDKGSIDSTISIINKFKKQNRHIVVNIFEIKSPIKIGFDKARNHTLRKASCDWVMWIDSDEVLYNPDRLHRYLKNNQFAGYAVKQHHISVEPLGKIKTDLPVRIFRNNIGVKFFGVVHEHPETELNKGVGHVMLLNDIDIAHFGYSTEKVRRKRFERNIGLLVRDRKTNPNRTLGKFLWMRDLAQMCQYELELNGNVVTKDMHDRAKIGIEIWDELVRGDNIRMCIDALEFYSSLSKILGGGFHFGATMDASKMNGGVHVEQQPVIQGYFNKVEHVNLLVSKMIEDKTKDYESRYF